MFDFVAMMSKIIIIINDNYSSANMNFIQYLERMT